MKSNKHFLVIFFLAIFLFSYFTCLFAYTPPSNLESKAADWTKANPVKFIENKGQLVDMNNQPVPFVLFKAESSGMNVYITEKGLTYLFIKNSEEGSSYAETSMDKDEKVTTEWNRVDMILKNATIKKENSIKEGESKNFSQYFLAHCPDGITDVHSYEKITIKEIYRGIDWVLYNSNERGFKYDFIIHPNADANQIKLIYEGSGRLEVNNNQIHFDNSVGEMDEGKLFCYQGDEDNEVNSKYIVKKNTERISPLLKGQSGDYKNSAEHFNYEVGIQIDTYNINQQLTIDPQLTWATFYGGNDLDGPEGIACDASNNVYTTGYVTSTNYPVLNAYQGVYGAAQDFFVTKFSNVGAMVWSTYYGGSSQDNGLSICVDLAGNIITVGTTSSTNFPVLNPGGGAYFQGTNFGGTYAFILKLTPAGTRIWSTYYGGGGSDIANSVCADKNGNIFVVGAADSHPPSSLAFPVLNAGGGAYYDATIGTTNADAFILKFNNAGARLWATLYGGDKSDEAYAVAADAAGNVFVGGRTSSITGNFPVLNTGGSAYFQGTYAGGTGAAWWLEGDAFILKFNNVGVRNWATYYGGSDNEQINSVCTDTKGNVIFLGTTMSVNFPILNALGGSFYQAANGGAQDAFVLKFDNTNTRIWATYLGGTGSEEMGSYTNLSIDKCDNVYAGIYTVSANMPLQNSCDAGYFYNSINGVSDIFILKFSPSNTLLWSTFFGGDNTDIREALVIDSNSNLFVTGEWTNQSAGVINVATYPLTNPGGGAYYDAIFNGTDDAYIAKFTQPTITASANAISSGCATSLSASATGGCSPYIYTWYNNSWIQIATTQTVSNTGTGTYHVIIRDSLTCSIDTATVVVAAAGGLNVFVTQSPSICNGQNFTLPDGSTVNIAGTYIDTLLSFNGCDSIITTNLAVVNALTTSQIPIICAGNSFTLPDGSFAITAGIYVDTLLSLSGCDSIITTNLTVVNALTTTQTPTICNGNTFTLPDGSSANTAGTYIDTLTAINGCDSIITTIVGVVNFLTGSQNISICIGNTFTLPGGGIVNSSGTYYDTLSTTSACDSVITTTITFMPASTGTQNPTICTGNNYILPGGSSVNTAGTYYDTISTSAGCDSIITTSLTVSVAITSSQSATLCNGNSFTLPSGAIVNTAGSYIDTLTASGGCDSIITTAITIKPNAASSQSQSICAGNSFTLPGGNVATASGTYYDTLTSFNGCDSVITIILTVNPAPTAVASANVIILPGQSATLTASGGGTYSWSPSTDLNNTSTNSVIATPTQTTAYCVEVTTTNGCKDTACVTVTVELPCPQSENLKVPNAFSPNNDGANDEFCLQGWDMCIENFNIRIYDRWGEKIFESKDPNFCWDGQYKGTIMEAQVFVYYLIAKHIKFDSSVSIKGNVSLIK